MPLPNHADLSLTQEELSFLEAHLREQYHGVFDTRMVNAHISEFVQSRYTDELARIVAASSRPGDALLDIGAGYGAFVLSCRRYGLAAVGVELESFEVEVSRRRLTRSDPGAEANSIFRKGDAGRLPFADDSFQIVAILNVLEHVPDYRAVLADAARVLRPGGRLIIVCPNYAALRREAHYHVPWLPFFPRRLASAYLRVLGRNPRFFERHIHYCTNWGVLNALRRLGLRTANLDLLRLENPELFNSDRAKLILVFAQRARLAPLVKLIIRFSFYNPFKAAVTVIANKAAL